MIVTITRDDSNTFHIINQLINFVLSFNICIYLSLSRYNISYYILRNNFLQYLQCHIAIALSFLIIINHNFSVYDNA